MLNPSLPEYIDLSTTTLALSNDEFEAMRKLIYDRFGINLTAEKKTLMVSRLQKLIKDRGFGTFAQLHQELVSDTTGALLSELVNRISTNHTFFNREPEHFAILKNEVLPEMVRNKKAKNQRDFRMWCAASSTGEEPYMLAMILRDHFGADFGSWEAGLLATDISEKALTMAKTGIYGNDRVQDLPPGLLKKYFSQKSATEYEANQWLKKDITFRRFNLINDSFPFKKPFDVIFCRNVMIYFDNPTKEKVVRNMSAFLNPGGYLFIGHSESLGRIQNGLRYVRPAMYRKEGA